MNTHPTHTQVGGWGLRPMIVPIGIGLLCCCVFCLIVGCVFFGCVSWRVCGGCFLFLSNLNTYANYFLYSSIDRDSEIAGPTLVQNPRSLRGSH